MSKEAKLKYKSGSFDIVEHGDHVICAISGKKILLENLKYWNVELQFCFFAHVFELILATTIPSDNSISIKLPAFIL